MAICMYDNHVHMIRHRPTDPHILNQSPKDGHKHINFFQKYPLLERAHKHDNRQPTGPVWHASDTNRQGHHHHFSVENFVHFCGALFQILWNSVVL